MSNGIRSLPRYQHGGPHPLPREPSWTREFGIPERGSVAPMPSTEDFMNLPPERLRAALNLRDFDRMAEVRAAILETPPRSRTAAEVREQFARRNPYAPAVSAGLRQRPGSFESYFPSEPTGFDTGEEAYNKWLRKYFDTDQAFDTRMEIEDVLLEIMDADITEEEIVQALDDPMFGGPTSGTASNAEIDERVYGRRYVNKMEEMRAGRERMAQPRGGWPAGTEAWAKPPTEHLPEVRGDWRTRGIAGLRKARASASRAASGAGITALKAVRDRLPAIIAAGAGTALASHPVSALADIALSPAKLGSGGLPEEDPYSSEDKIKYYEDLMSLGGGLDIGQHYPPVLQLSREVNGPSIRSSYPMRHTRR
jgi:hypothetical protein